MLRLPSNIAMSALVVLVQKRLHYLKLQVEGPLKAKLEDAYPEALAQGHIYYRKHIHNLKHTLYKYYMQYAI